MADKTLTSSQIEITTGRMSLEDCEEKLREGLTRTDTKLVNLAVAKVGDHFVEKTVPGNPANKYKVWFSDFVISLTWEAAIPGHTPIAHLNLEEGMLTSFAGEMTKSDYDQMDGRCDCCNAQRIRKHQFLIENDETNTRFVVGGSCAKKFVGVNLNNVANALLRLRDKVEGIVGEDGWFGGGETNTLSTGLVLCVASFCINRWGWAAKSSGMTHTTAGDIGQCLLAMDKNNRNPSNHTIIDEKDYSDLCIHVNAADIDQIAEDYIIFVQAQLDARWNDYMQTCLNLLENRCCSHRAIGRLAYLPVAWGKEEIRRKQRDDRAKRVAYQAEVGKMHNLPGCWQVVAAKEYESDYGSYTAFTAVSDKDECIWFRGTAGTRDLEIGKSYTLRAKVKTVKDTITFLSHAKTVEA